MTKIGDLFSLTLDKIKENEDILKKQLFSDEATFHVVVLLTIITAEFRTDSHLMNSLNISVTLLM